MQAILIAATSSNCGKTTFTMGLLRALKKNGVSVQPFKCGPDYIDPMFHRQASGTDSINLDCVMSSTEHVKDLFHRYSEGAEVSIVEGVMGMYDGRDRWHGSSAEIAMILDLPVILLVDAKSTAYSIAPLLYGFKHFCPASSKPLNILGVVFNRVGSERHYQLLFDACQDVGIDVLGYIPNNPKLSIPSRHLGLSTDELARLEELIEESAKEVSDHIKLDKICRF